ncbi:MAG: hypothetical protein IJ751_08195, partial [Oscillospiraceae bacterium]|nr:hypothetical protein [Oscillospiraceae bacterium]
KQCADPGLPPQGVTLLELVDQAGIPYLRAKRICDSLVHRKIILEQAGAKEDALYYPGDGFFQLSLKDIIGATEGNSHLLSVFDRKSELFRTHGKQLEHVEDDVDRLLSDVSLANLFCPDP